MQRDPRSGRGGGVGRTAVGACGHGGGDVRVGGGVSTRCGVCAVVGHHLWKGAEVKERKYTSDYLNTVTSVQLIVGVKYGDTH